MTLAVLLGLIANVAAQLAGAPGLIDYQGQLLNNLGGPITGAGGPGTTGTAANFEIRFRIWDSQTATDPGNLIWAEKQIVTVTVDGFFSVRLGEGEEITSADGETLALVGSIANGPGALLGSFNGKERFLGVTVIPAAGVPGEISPRLAFLASPFAVVAESAKYAEFGPLNGVFSAAQVGIGNSSPLSPLQVEGNSIFGDAFNPAPVNGSNILNVISGANANGASNGISFFESDADNFGMSLGYDGTADALRFYNNSGGAVMSLLNGGNVGIGIANPTGKFEVSGGITATSSDPTHDPGAHLEYGRAASGATFLLNQKGPGPGGVVFGEVDSGNAVTEHMRVAATGNVGIGTNAPQSRLTIYEPSGQSGAPQSGTLTLQHGNPGGASSIVFPSAQNPGSDFGAISYLDNLGTPGGEKSALVLSTNNDADDHILLLPSGNVGIGTTNPFRGQLEVVGSATTAAGPYSIQVNNFAQNHLSSTGTGIAPSIYADGSIAGANIIAFSDARIKEISGQSNAKEDLEVLSSIQITDYTYKDFRGKGKKPQKKVIAQQVREVFPQAVEIATDVIPDLYEICHIGEGWVDLKTDLKKGERVRLIDGRKDGVFEVLEVEGERFRTSYRTTAQEIFVFGREVDDFHSVDYDAIAMLNVSATQEIKREKDAEIKALQEANLKLQNRLAAQERRLIALEQILLSPHKGTTQQIATSKTLNQVNQPR